MDQMVIKTEDNDQLMDIWWNMAKCGRWWLIIDYGHDMDDEVDGIISGHDIEFDDNGDGYIIGGHDAEYREKDDRQKGGHR